MINLNIEIIAKCLIAIPLIVVSFLIKKRIKVYRSWLIIFVFSIVSIYTGNQISALIPHLTETVSFTVLKDSYDNNILASEVNYLYCILNSSPDSNEDGAVYQVTKFHSGKWFWRGDNSIMWRSENDVRKPSELTRDISIQIPVGKYRTLLFSCGKTGGSVEVSTERGKTIINTYAESEGIISYNLPESSDHILAYDVGIHLLVYTIACYITLAFSIFIILQLTSQQSWLRQIISKYWQEGTYLLIAIHSFFYFNSFADSDSFWFDELAQTHFVSHTLLYSITVDPHTPPLYNIILWCWYQIAPYGEKWLLIPGELFVAIGIFVLSLTGRKFFGYVQGLIAALFCVGTTTVAYQCANEFRSYSLMFLASAMFCYFLLEYIENPKQRNRSNILGFTLSSIILAYSHYFGLFMIVPVFLIDVFLFFQKKTNKVFIVPYLISGLAYSPWVLFVVLCKPYVELTWLGVPTIKSIFELTEYLCSGSRFLHLFFVIGYIFCIIKFFRSKMITPDFTLFFIICFLIFGIYFYATHIAIKSTFWLNRYFTCLIPCVYLIFANGFVMMSKLSKVYVKENYVYILATAILIWVIAPIYYNTKTSIYHTTNHRGSAKYLYNQSDDIFNQDTIIITTTGVDTTDAFLNYYITEQGKRDTLKVANTYADIETLYENKIVYVVYWHNGQLSSPLQEALKENYTLVYIEPDINIRKYIRNY